MGLGIEQRSEPRRRLLHGGRIVEDHGGFSLSCMIVDISDSGARVRVEQSAHLPARFYLVDTRDRVVFRTNLAWSSDREHGVRILAKAGLASPSQVPNG